MGAPYGVRRPYPACGAARSGDARCRRMAPAADFGRPRLTFSAFEDTRSLTACSDRSISRFKTMNISI
eukprot:6197579-Pleurochrysis_carterae.AAC.1